MRCARGGHTVLGLSMGWLWRLLSGLSWGYLVRDSYACRDSQVSQHDPLRRATDNGPVARGGARGGGAGDIGKREDRGVFGRTRPCPQQRLPWRAPAPSPPSPSLPHPRRHLRVPSPWRSSQQRCPQRLVRRLSGAVLSAEANGPHGGDETSSWQRRSPSPPPPPSRPHHIGGPPIPSQALCGRSPRVPAPPDW